MTIPRADHVAASGGSCIGWARLRSCSSPRRSSSVSGQRGPVREERRKGLDPPGRSRQREGACDHLVGGRNGNADKRRARKRSPRRCDRTDGRFTAADRRAFRGSRLRGLAREPTRGARRRLSPSLVQAAPSARPRDLLRLRRRDPIGVRLEPNQSPRPPRLVRRRARRGSSYVTNETSTARTSPSLTGLRTDKAITLLEVEPEHRPLHGGRPSYRLLTLTQGGAHPYRRARGTRRE